jgi:hypothetical protein
MKLKDTLCGNVLLFDRSYTKVLATLRASDFSNVSPIFIFYNLLYNNCYCNKLADLHVLTASSCKISSGGPLTSISFATGWLF